MSLIRRSFALVWKFLSYIFVFMVNPKAVIFKEVDDELDKDDKNATKI